MEHGRNVEAQALAQELLDRRPDSNFAPYLLWFLGESRRQVGDFDGAVATLEQLAALTPEQLRAEHSLGAAHAAEIRAKTFGSLAQVYLDLGLRDQAFPLIEQERLGVEAMPANWSNRRNALVGWHVHRVASALLARHYDAVLRLVAEALNDAALYDRYPGYRAALLVARAVARQQGAPDDSARGERAEADLLTALIEPRLPAVQRVEARLWLAYLRLRRGAFAPAAAVLAHARAEIEAWAADDNRRRPVPEAAELALLEAKLALDRPDSTPAELAEELQRMEHALRGFLALWRSTPLRSGGIGFLAKASRKAFLAEYARLLVRVRGTEAGGMAWLEALARAHTAGSTARRHGLEPFTAAAARRELLAGGGGMLVYLTARDRSVVVCVDQHQLTVHPLAPEHLVGETLRRYVTVLHEPPVAAGSDAAARAMQREEERRRAHELATLLLPRDVVQRVDGWSAVTIMGQDILGAVPFACLPFGAAAMLGTEMPLDYVSSFPLAGQLLREAQARARRPLPTDELRVLAAPTTPPDVLRRWPDATPLPFAASDRERLVGSYRPGRAHVHSGKDAGRRWLTEAAARPVSVIQLLVHGVLDDTREAPVGLVLAADDRGEAPLWYEDVLALPAPPLVLLTCCQSGAGSARQGDAGVTRLGTAWLLAGAQAVLTAEAPLAYRPTLRLSALFHERLRRHGATPAVALRDARRQLAADPVLGAPFYHGLLQIHGLGHRAVFAGAEASIPAPARRWPGSGLAWAGGASALVGALFLWRGRRRRHPSP
ncbi:MAG: CHAT domain-containing protein [Planctomycetota bacterium]